jgi:hypothetical protein
MALEQKGWIARGFRVERGKLVEDEIGVFDSFRDADMASDAWTKRNRKVRDVHIEHNYVEVEDEPA